MCHPYTCSHCQGTAGVGGAQESSLWDDRTCSVSMSSSQPPASASLPSAMCFHRRGPPPAAPQPCTGSRNAKGLCDGAAGPASHTCSHSPTDVVAGPEASLSLRETGAGVTAPLRSPCPCPLHTRVTPHPVPVPLPCPGAPAATASRAQGKPWHVAHISGATLASISQGFPHRLRQIGQGTVLSY